MEYKRFPLGPLWTNGYLLWDEKGTAFFVDPGGDPSEVIDFIKGENLLLKAVILTHGHADHILGVASMVASTGAMVMIHRSDEELLSEKDKNLSSHLGTDCPVLKSDRVFEDGDDLKIGSMNISIIHTPGHTMGSSCLLVSDGEDRILLSGDTLFARSIGRTDLPGGDPHLIGLSLSKLTSLEDNLKVLPGHGPETTIGVEKKQNPFF